MNKIVLLIVAVLLPCFMATAQEGYTVTYGGESRDMEPAMLRNGKYLGKYEGKLCWAIGSYGQRKRVVMLDSNMTLTSSLELPESSESCELVTATYDDGKAYLMYVDSNYDKMTLLFASTVDLATMTPAEGTMPMRLTDSLSYGRKDHCYVWGATSPDGKTAAVIYIVEYTERMQYSARAILFDNHLQEQWVKDYALGSMENLCVTNDGTMVTLGYEDDGDETHFIFNILSRDRAESFDAVVQCNHVRQLKLAGIVGNKAMAVGTFSPAEGRWSDQLCEGVLTMAFDIESASLTGFNMRTFQNEELNILLNMKTKKVQRYQDIDLVSISGYTTTNYGAVVAVGRNWHLNRTEDNGTTSLSYHRMGLHIVATDTNGHITWMRNLRRNDVQAKDDYLLGLDMTSRDGVTYIMRSEHRRTPQIYDIGREAKQLMMGEKTMMALYTIDADGEVQKNVLEARTPFSLLRTIPQSDGTLMTIGAAGHRTRIGVVSER